MLSLRLGLALYASPEHTAAITNATPSLPVRALPPSLLSLMGGKIDIVLRDRCPIVDLGK